MNEFEFTGFITEMEKEAGLKKWIAGGLLGASLMHAPQMARAETMTAKQLMGNRTVSSAVWEQYKANRTARQLAMNVDMNKYNPHGFPGRTRAATGKTAVPVQRAVQPQVAQSAPTPSKNIVDKAIDTGQEFERKTGLKVRPSGITKKLGQGSVTINKKKQLSGEYNLGGFNVKGTQKGIDEISKGFGNWRAYVQPQKKQIGVGYGINF